MIKILRVAVIAGVLGVLATFAPARAAFFNFDNLPSPGPTPLVLPGVTFTPNYGGEVFSYPTDYFPGNQVYSVQTDVGAYMKQVLAITFDRPVFLVKFMLFRSSLSLTANALDSHGNLVDIQDIYNNPYSNRILIVLCAKGIKSVLINTGEDSLPIYIDNFSFYPLAPSATIIPMN
jgi:hypothetical protein